MKNFNKKPLTKKSIKKIIKEIIKCVAVLSIAATCHSIALMCLDIYIQDIAVSQLSSPSAYSMKLMQNKDSINVGLFIILTVVNSIALSKTLFSIDKIVSLDQKSKSDPSGNPDNPDNTNTNDNTNADTGNTSTNND